MIVHICGICEHPVGDMAFWTEAHGWTCSHHEVEMECNGLCIDSSDVGVPGYGIAYAHPGCPQHR